jgi:alanine racemase
VGIVPQGYSDGFDRGLSSAADVLVRGKRCPVLGRIAMNMFAIDLNGVPEAKAEDEVVLLGAQNGQRITAEEIGRRISTINYEVVTRVSPLLKRVVV